MVSELMVRASQRSVAGSVVTGGVFVLGPVKTGDHQSYFIIFLIMCLCMSLYT